MNILVLTPDRVGSTLLQRVITIHMANTINETIPPVVNLHELTNGIEEYYSEEMGGYAIAKPKMEDWGYHQSLTEITNLLKKYSNKQSITSRLAHYHLVRRDDGIAEQAKFYDFLNKNFFIIACQRNSVFEHALSWGIESHSKVLNVYSHKQKIKACKHLYNNDQITIPIKGLIKYLDAYKKYITWYETYFNVNEFYVYEEHMSNIDEFVQNLDCFNQAPIDSWESIFGIGWMEWNRCHRLLSDLTIPDSTKLLDVSHSHVSEDANISSLVANLPLAEQKFLEEHSSKYLEASIGIDQLIKNRTLVTGIPIKLQTLVEKKMIIKNFNECAVAYNEWALENGFNIIENSDEIVNQARDELQNWYTEIPYGLRFLE